MDPGPAVGDMESGQQKVPQRRQRRSGMWNQGMGTGTLEGGGAQRSERSQKDSVLDVS